MTIVTPASNAAHLLPEAIRSVLDQTMSDFEHLIINDASTDATLQVARAWATRDERIRVVDLDRHGGVGWSRNAGVRAGRGAFVAFVDADDRWAPTFLEDQLQSLNEAGPDALASFCHSVNFEDGTGRLIGLHAPAAGRYGLARMFLGRCAPGNGSSLLIRRSAFDRVGLFDETLPRGEDVDMWLRFLANTPGGYFVCLPRVLTYRRLHAGSRTTGRHFMIDQQIDVYAERLARFMPAIDPRFHARMYLTYIITVLVVRSQRAHRQSRLWADQALQLSALTWWERIQAIIVPPLLRLIGPELYAVYRWQRWAAARLRMRSARVPALSQSWRLRGG